MKKMFGNDRSRYAAIKKIKKCFEWLLAKNNDRWRKVQRHTRNDVERYGFKIDRLETLVNDRVLKTTNKKPRGTKGFREI